MEKVKVYEQTALLKSLAGNLENAAEKVAAAGDAWRKLFPARPWNTNTLWVLIFEPAARRVAELEILKREAERAGLPCAWDLPDTPAPAARLEILRESIERPQPLSEEIRFNRRLVEMQAREALAPFRELNGLAHIGTYLRTGVLSIGKKGEIITAPDAAERLADYCTLYAETKQQRAFVAALDNMRQAAEKMQAAYIATTEAIPNKLARQELTANAGFYMPRLGAITKRADGQIRLFDADAPARALITFFGLDWETKETAPKFYNESGVLVYQAAEAAALIGCDPEKLGALHIWEAYPRAYGRKKDPAKERFPYLDVFPKLPSRDKGAEG